MRTGTGNTPIELLYAILATELNAAIGLEKDRIFIYDEKFKIPPDNGLFVVLELKSTRTLANRRAYEATGAGGALQEVQCLNTQERYVVGIFSRNTDALFKKEFVQFALNSTTAQISQEVNSYTISRILPAEDLSAVEGAAMLRRFDIEVVLLAWYKKTQDVPYYETYRVQVDTEQKQVSFDQPTEEP